MQQNTAFENKVLLKTYTDQQTRGLNCRKTLLLREVLKIEYHVTHLFSNVKSDIGAKSHTHTHKHTHTHLARDHAALVVGGLAEEVLRLVLLLLVLPALALQLLELQVLEALRLRLQGLAVLTHAHTHRKKYKTEEKIKQNESKRAAIVLKTAERNDKLVSHMPNQTQLIPHTVNTPNNPCITLKLPKK